MSRKSLPEIVQISSYLFVLKQGKRKLLLQNSTPKNQLEGFKFWGNPTKS